MFKVRVLNPKMDWHGKKGELRMFSNFHANLLAQKGIVELVESVGQWPNSPKQIRVRMRGREDKIKVLQKEVELLNARLREMERGVKKNGRRRIRGEGY